MNSRARHGRNRVKVIFQHHQQRQQRQQRQQQQQQQQHQPHPPHHDQHQHQHQRPQAHHHKLPARQQQQQHTMASTESINPAAAPAPAAFDIPFFFSEPPPIRDALESDSSRKQDATVDECLPFLAGSNSSSPPRNGHGLPPLDRARHARFLHTQLGDLPGAFTAADPSRPWFFYWCLNGLALLSRDAHDNKNNDNEEDDDTSDTTTADIFLDEDAYRPRLVQTLRCMQNPAGGFGGGFGQTSHLATTYASVLALAIVGGPDAYDLVDRRSMWKWLSMLKQPDGGFQMALGGEEDVRGAYCAAVIISLLDLPLELAADSPACAAGHTTLFGGLAEWIGSCQTYEGGVGAKPGVEAHGAYAFCALGCLSIIDAPHRSIARHLDMPRLLAWLSSRQYAPEGGLAGRTNKLVDGCYSHWIGGCWPLIEASLRGPEDPRAEAETTASAPARADTQTLTGTPDDSLFSRNGLIRYILCCCQDMSKRGGMRDKPSKYSDAYHSCYVLAGLSSAQHRWRLLAARPEPTLLRGDRWAVAPYPADATAGSPASGPQIFREEDRVAPTHPVYVIPPQKVEAMWAHFANKQGF